MRSRAILAAAVLSSALVTGGWLMERGSSRPGRDLASRAKLFDEVLTRLKSDYVDSLADSTLFRHAVDGALEELHDPHTVFLDPKRLGRLDESTSGHYAGVGIQMDVRDSGITVIATLPGSPAEQAGVATGDRITTIDGKSTHGLTSEEALKTLRGDKGSSVRIQVERPGVAEPLTFSLVRREIEVHAVQHAMLLDGGIGYVDLTVFSANAANELSHAVDSLRAAGARSLLLDLRGDPGGLLDQGVGVADLFLDQGQKIVSTKGRSAEETRSFSDGAPQRWKEMPLVVLTDSGTASASEIVAGALQDHDRAVVVGTATYGKGSAQRVYRLNDGALKITTALWYTPSGRSINRLRPSVSDDEEDAPPARDTAAPRPRFRTDGGRTVLGGGGIVPDVIVAKRTATDAEKTFQSALGAKVPQFRDALLEYALSLKVSHAVATPQFDVTPAMRDELYRRLQARGIAVSRALYDSASPLVSRAIATQVVRYAFGPRAEFTRALADDPTAVKAEELLRGATSQQVLLSRVPAVVK